MPIEGNKIILLTSRTKRQRSCGDAIGILYNFTEYLFQAETQVVSVLEITLKRCSSPLEISPLDALYDRQGYSNPACHLHCCKSFHLPYVGKPSTHLLNDTSAIG